MLPIQRELPKLLPLLKMANQGMLPPVIFLHLQNIKSVAATRTACQLKCRVVENTETINPKTQYLARIILQGKHPMIEVSQKVENLAFDQFQIQIGNQKIAINRDDIHVALLDEEEYQTMLSDFFGSDDSVSESINSEEKNQSPNEPGFYHHFNYLLAKILTTYSKFAQKTVLRLKKLREQELYRNTEENHQRKKKIRDKKWNQRMDYWLAKELNRYSHRVERLKKELSQFS